MKSLQQSESMPTEFHGLTAEEAVQRARLVLGHDAPVRCWKTRTGGVLGFFSQEIFIAGLNEPAGAQKKSKPDKKSTVEDRPRNRKISLKARRRLGEDLTPDVPELSSPQPRTMLADLVESTHDVLTVEDTLLAKSSFIDVLAEAEAALADLDTLDEQVFGFTREEPLSELLAPQESPRVEQFHRVQNEPIFGFTREEPLSEFPAPTASPHAEQLRSVLDDLGVPGEYQAAEGPLTFDDVASSLEKLPRPEPVPSDAGSVIVVVGAKRDAKQSAQKLIEELQLTSADLITFEDTAACRQRINRRRSSRKSSVIVLEVSSRLRELSAAAQQLEKLRADFVLGTIPATMKRSDVEHWQAQLGRLDALALTRWAKTTSPAELMGTLPIMYVDGRRASTIRWMVLTLEEMERRAR